MVTNTSTVGATGRDHVSIAVWEGVVQSSADNEIADCFADADLDRVNISGAAGGFRRVQAATGERHSGTASSGGVTVNPSSDGIGFNISDDNVEIIGIVIKGITGVSSEGVRFNVTSGGLIDSCVIEGDGVTATQDGIFTADDDTDFTVQNCSIYNWTRTGIHIQQVSTGTPHTITVNLYNNSIWLCGFNYGFRQGHASSVIAFDMIDNSFLTGITEDIGRTGGPANTPTITGDFNIDSDSNAFTPGPNSLQGRTATDNPAPGFGDWVIFEDISTPATYSLLLQNLAANHARHSGVGPAVEAKIPLTDIAGDPRSGATANIGCDEFPIPVLENNDLQSEFLSTRTPDKRWIPKAGGSTAVGELATHSGAPLLPELCPLAWDDSAGKWRAYTQPSDAAIVTLTRDAGGGDGGSFTFFIDGLGVALAWDADTADILAAINFVLADEGKPYTASVANSGSGTDLGTAANVQTITFTENAGAPTIQVDTSGLTDGGLNEPTGIALAITDAGTDLNGTDIIRALVGDAGGKQTSATEEVQCTLYKAGTTHRDDINTADVRAACSGTPSESEIDAALIALNIRDDGLDIQDLVGVR